MGSFSRKPNNRRSVYLKLAGEIEGQLRQAYAKRNEQKRETQVSVAEKLGVDRSAVNRRLVGRTNMTIETIADMVWALGHCIKVEIFDPEDHPSNEHRIVPVDEGAAETGSSANAAQTKLTFAHAGA